MTSQYEFMYSRTDTQRVIYLLVIILDHILYTMFGEYLYIIIIIFIINKKFR